MSEYSRIDKLLHRIALKLTPVRELSFTLDQTLFGKAESTLTDHQPVYVCGLARAGTSILFRTLYQTGQFSTLTYRNMPFVLAPRLWQRLSGKYQSEATNRERAHNDGMMVNFDSPEAFEEVFWLTFCGETYVEEDSLKTHQVPEDVAQNYRNFVSAVIDPKKNSQRRRYLCKNNNNILRIPGLLRAFPQARILVMFRDPLQHANSLLSQHRNFCRQQQDDKFVADYMNWLGHFEFGLNHRPFEFDSDHKFTSDKGPDHLEYWLAVWGNVYSFLQTYTSDQLMFVSYERLCDAPELILEKLTEDLGINQGDITGTPHNISKKDASKTEWPSNGKLKQDLEALYRQLEERSI